MGFRSWLEATHADDVVHMDEHLRIIDNLFEDVTQESLKPATGRPFDSAMVTSAQYAWSIAYFAAELQHDDAGSYTIFLRMEHRQFEELLAKVEPLIIL